MKKLMIFLVFGAFLSCAEVKADYIIQTYESNGHGDYSSEEQYVQTTPSVTNNEYINNNNYYYEYGSYYPYTAGYRVITPVVYSGTGININYNRHHPGVRPGKYPPPPPPRPKNEQKRGISSTSPFDKRPTQNFANTGASKIEPRGSFSPETGVVRAKPPSYNTEATIRGMSSSVLFDKKR